jgi:hypothetical protein
MGVTNKHKMDEVAERLGILDPNDPRVLAEVERQLAVNERRVLVIGAHPNGSPIWLEKMGTEQQIIDYLKQAAQDGRLDYVCSVIVMEEGAEDSIADWLEFLDGEPIAIKPRQPAPMLQPPPPLPGIEDRLTRLQASYCLEKHSVWQILQSLTDEEVEQVFAGVLESMMQEGKPILGREVELCQQM